MLRLLMEITDEEENLLDTLREEGRVPLDHKWTPLLDKLLAQIQHDKGSRFVVITTLGERVLKEGSKV